MTSMNENSMAAPTPLPPRIPCGEYQQKDEKGMLVPLGRYVLVRCFECEGRAPLNCPCKDTRFLRVDPERCPIWPPEAKS